MTKFTDKELDFWIKLVYAALEKRDLETLWYLLSWSEVDKHDAGTKWFVEYRNSKLNWYD